MGKRKVGKRKVGISIMKKRYWQAMAATMVATAQLFWCASASAQMADRLTSDDILAVLEQAGFEVTMSTDKNNGTPVARASAGDLVFVVRAMDCDGTPLACSQLILFANFDLNRDTTDSDFKIVNDFNDSSLDGRAYVLDRTNQIGIDFVVDLSGGVSPDHIADRLSRWEGIVSRFISDFRSARTGS